MWWSPEAPPCASSFGRDSLAGRVTTLEAGVLSLTEIATFRGQDLGAPLLPDNGLEPVATIEFWEAVRDHGCATAEDRDAVFGWFSERGGYPLVHQHAEVSWSLLADQLNETVIRRVIQHDLRLGDRGRKRDPRLLEAALSTRLPVCGTGARTTVACP